MGSKMKRENEIAEIVKNHSTDATKKVVDEVPLVELELNNITYAPTTIKHQLKKKIANSADGNNEVCGSVAKSNKTIVLDDVSTKVSPYKLTAWMGPSGSGKSSLVSVAANLIPNPNEDIIGDSEILVNGDVGYIPKRLVGVVWQDDMLLSNLTVEENIYFSARLKTSRTAASDDDVRMVVQETMEELGILHIRESIVG